MVICKKQKIKRGLFVWIGTTMRNFFHCLRPKIPHFIKFSTPISIAFRFSAKKFFELIIFLDFLINLCIDLLIVLCCLPKTFWFLLVFSFFFHFPFRKSSPSPPIDALQTQNAFYALHFKLVVLFFKNATNFGWLKKIQLLLSFFLCFCFYFVFILFVCLFFFGL